jgi:hypothetical protein
MAQAQTGIEVTAKVFPLAFLLYLTHPDIAIDGSMQAQRWGTHFLPTPQGRHTVKVSFPYLWIKEAGPASVEVDVAEGEVVRLVYKHPLWWVFAKGKIRRAS